MNRILTVILGAGTTTCRIALRGHRAARALGSDAVAVLAACEPAGELGICPGDGVAYTQIPPDVALIRAITNHPGQHPWLKDGAARDILGRGSNSGVGQGGWPGGGRSAFTLVSAPIFDQLAEIGRDAKRYNRKVECLILVNTPGGTSRGSLMEIGLLAHAALPKAVRRMLVVLPHLQDGVFVHSRRTRALNAYTALAQVKAGMTPRRWAFHGRNGLQTSAPTTIADEILLTSPYFQLDERASVKELASIDEIVTAVARQVEGIAAGALPYRKMADLVFDSATDWKPGRPLSALAETRIWLDDARLRAEVERELIVQAMKEAG